MKSQNTKIIAPNKIKVKELLCPGAACNKIKSVYILFLFIVRRINSRYHFFFSTSTTNCNSCCCEPFVLAYTNNVLWFIPVLPSLLKDALIVPCAPGATGSLGCSATVQPQLGCTRVITSGFVPVFLKA